PLMTSSGSGPNDLFNELGRQVGAIGNRAEALPRRLDESLERLEQGDLQLQVRMGESDRQLRRMISVQKALGQSVLLGSLGIAAALLGASSRPIWAVLPLIAALPVGFGWFKLQIKLGRESRMDHVSSQSR
ncbi:MAG: AarF/ABC1/UbiB kinase family protein, partial [Cyanobacteriota bacterium]|nr:AarF/ABC1/UbiB kinase family protein [Cyanobacteriota bacterium]